MLCSGAAVLAIAGIAGVASHTPATPAGSGSVLAGTSLSWDPSKRSLGLGTTAPEGGIHLMDAGATADRTSLSLDSSRVPLRRRSVRYLTGGVLRWGLDVDPAAERGMSDGSYFGINAYKDDGTYARTQFVMRRDNGATTWFPNDRSALMAIGRDTVAPGNRLTIRGAVGNVLRLQADAGPTGLLQTALVSQGIAAGAMPSGFGVQHLFSIQAGDGSEKVLARVHAAVSGASQSGTWAVATANSGVLETGLTVTPGARVVIGGGLDNGKDQLQVSGNARISGKLYIKQETPASSSSSCTTGQLAYDRNYVYVCTGPDTWKRSALTSW